MLKLVNVEGETNVQYKKIKWYCKECVFVFFMFLSMNLYNLWMVVYGSKNCWVIVCGSKNCWVIVGYYMNYLVVFFAIKNIKWLILRYEIACGL
jgi:hypothetical protein